MLNNSAAPPRPRAYSYVRMSTDRQKTGDSLRRQIERSRAYAEQNGLELADDELHDLGVSAYKGANVSDGALGRFIAAVEAGDIPQGSYLIVESLDRVTRQDILSAAELFSRIVRAGIVLVTLQDGHRYDTALDPMQFMYSIMVLSRAHEESQVKSYRSKANWEKKRRSAAENKLTATSPAWLVLADDRKKFLAIPERAKLIRRMFEDCAAGIGVDATARRLNRERHPTWGRSDGWHGSYITKILTNRAVLGEFQPCRKENGKRIPDGPPVRDYYPAVVSEDLFYRARNARTQRRVGGAGRRGSHVSNLFSGLTQCAYCHGPVRFLNKGPKPKGRAYLVCERGRRGMGCETKLWEYDAFEKSFLSFVRELDLGAVIGDPASTRRAQEQERIEELQGKITELEEKRSRTYDLLVEQRAPDPFLKGKLAELTEAIAAANADLEEAQRALELLMAEAAEADLSKQSLRDLIKRIQDRQGPDAYRLRSDLAARIRGVVSSISVAPAGRLPSLKRNLESLEGESFPFVEDLRSIYRHDLEFSEEATWRFLAIEFKDGSFQVVKVDPDDPHSYHVDIRADDSGISASRSVRASRPPNLAPVLLKSPGA